MRTAYDELTRGFDRRLLGDDMTEPRDTTTETPTPEPRDDDVGETGEDEAETVVITGDDLVVTETPKEGE